MSTNLNSMQKSTPELPPGELELVWGCKAIGREIGLSPRQVFHMLENDRLPAKKISGKWCASRAGLRRFFGELLAGEIAA